MLDTAPKGYDVEAVRRDFPILSREVYGKPLVYLDNGASAQKPTQVLKAIESAYAETYANVHRGLHFLSNTSTDKFEEARRKVQAFLAASSEDEIIFTKNATEAFNLVAYGMGLDGIEAGDEIVLSIMEHHSNIVPWHFLRERKGAVLKWAPVDDDGNFLLEEFEALLTEKTKLVAITHMSNVLGTVVPVKKVIELAHARGIKVLVDGSQAAVHMPVDVVDLDADYYIFTGHKLYGPSGIGVLYGKKELLSQLPPFLGGGEMIDTVTTETVTYGVPPHRFEAGTPPIVQAIGLGAAIDYVTSIGREAIAAYEAELAAYAHEALSEVKSLRLIGNAKEKGGIFSFALEGVHAHDVSTLIDRSGVAVRAGTHCAEPLMARFGVTSTCRASLAMYNVKTDIDVLVAALRKAEEFFG
ncbi:MAG: cysteine desulfurase [Rhodomicrobium sp.]|nr:MAG: cysteine desulfurase [Rhodomicrobium sp.]